MKCKKNSISILITFICLHEKKKKKEKNLKVEVEYYRKRLQQNVTCMSFDVCKFVIFQQHHIFVDIH